MQLAVVDDEPRAALLEDLGRLRADGAPYEEVQARYRQQQSVLRRYNAYYRSYQAKNGIVTVGCLSDRLRKRMADVLGLYDIRFLPDYDPTSEESILFMEDLVKKAETILKKKTVEEWLVLFDQAGVPAGPMRFVEELVTDQQVVANNLVVELNHSLAGSVKMVGPAVSMSESPLEAKMASPALGEHSDEILGQLGYSPEEIRKLKDDNVTR